MSRRSLVMLGVALASALVAGACAEGDDGVGATGPSEQTGPSEASGTSEQTGPADVRGTIRLFSYSDGFDPEYLAGFYEMYPGIELETAGFGSNDAAVARILAGFEADVINSCVDESTLDMVQRGLYAPLDVSRLEHWDEIWPGMKELPGVVVDGEVYLVPVDAGTAGIMYNADVITEPPDSWLDLFDPAYDGKAALEDLSVTAIDIGALALGYEDPLSITPEQLEEVKAFLIEHKSHFRTFYESEADVKALFKSGEIIISSGYPGTAKVLRNREGVNVQFAPAKEGQMLWTCGYGISPEIDPANLDAAYALLNYYTSLPPQIYAATTWNYLTSNQGIIDAVPPEIVEEASLDSLYDLENAIPASPPQDKSAWTAAWQEVKAA